MTFQLVFPSKANYPPKTNMTMETQPFEDVFAIRKWLFSRYIAMLLFLGGATCYSTSTFPWSSGRSIFEDAQLPSSPQPVEKLWEG